MFRKREKKYAWDGVHRKYRHIRRGWSGWCLRCGKRIPRFKAHYMYRDGRACASHLERPKVPITVVKRQRSNRG